MATLHLHSIAYPVSSLGPGHRVALWVSGCPLACPGCITPELWNRNAGYAVPVHTVVERLTAIDLPLDGVSLTGGEPFEQAHALGELVQSLAAARPDWNVLCFTGFSMRELSKKPNSAALLSVIDVLIAGRYVAKRPSSEPLIASTNQQHHYLSSRGEQLRRAFENLDAAAADLALGQNGQKLLVGVLDPERRANIHRTLSSDSEEPESKL